MVERDIEYKQAMYDIFMVKKLFDLKQHCISNYKVIGELKEFENTTLDIREYFDWSSRVLEVLQAL